MKRRPILKISVFAGAAALIASLGGLAFARGRGGMCGGRGEFMKQMVSGKIDDALDYAKVDAGQKAKIQEIRDNVFKELEANKPNKGEKLGELKDLFLADKIDQSKVDALRNEHQAKMQKMGDVFEKAFVEVHDTLTPEQRAKIVEYVEKNKPRHFRED